MFSKRRVKDLFLLNTVIDLLDTWNDVTKGCGMIKFYYLSTDMVKIHLSNQDLLARKLTFFLFLEETYVVGTH